MRTSFSLRHYDLLVKQDYHRRQTEFCVHGCCLPGEKYCTGGMEGCLLGSYIHQDVKMKIATVLKFIPPQGVKQDFSGISTWEPKNYLASSIL